MTFTKAVLAVVAVALAAVWLLVAAPAFPPPASDAPIRADASRLESDVRYLVNSASPRDYEHVDNLNKAAAYIKSRLQEAGATVSEQAFKVGERNRQNQKIERGPYKNIIAAFGPDTRERLVIGAHYDAAGPFPAADDNASGVAGLLELARLLQKTPPALRTELVAYTLEEPPYFGTPMMGSAVHAARLATADVHVRAMISLEMLGYFSDAPHSQSFPIPLLRLFYPSKGNFIAVVGALRDGSLAKRIKRSMRGVRGLSVCSMNSPAWVPGVDFSDHRSYWRQGYDAVMITDTAFFRNHAYHTAQDVPERLDYPRMARVVEGVSRAVADLSH